LKLLLDTCAFIWLVSTPAQLSQPAVAAIESPATELFLSDCSVWEICLKWEAGKLQLPKPPRLWIEEQRSLWRLGAVPIGRFHLYRVSELAAHHRDPFDRLIVAQAIEEGMTVVTPDLWIARYPVAILW